MALQDDVDTLVSQARRMGTDTSGVEIKRAQGGVPKTLAESISAFANGDGGLIILGLDEEDEFAAVPIPTRAMADALANACSDQVEPPVRARVEIVQVDNVPIVAASIPPCDPKQRPCFVRRQGIEGGSYIRTHDGDRHLTSYEIHLLIEGRGQPHNDGETVPGATLADLDQSAVDALLERLRSTRGPAFATAEPATMLRMAGVCPRGEASGRVTLAGLMALGTYPQEFFPQLNVTFVSFPTTDGAPMADGTRFLENVAIDGSIPQMVSRLVDVVMRSMTRRSVMEGIGRRDIWEYPIDAVRELVVNALMHRDYHPLAHGAQVQVEMYPDRLVFRNPGGLFGDVSTHDLLDGRASSSRNAILARLLEDLPMPGTNHMVCENRGSGIAMIERELATSGQQPAVFRPTPSLFVAEVRSLAMPTHQVADAPRIAPISAHDTEPLIISLLADGPKTSQELQSAIGVSRPTVTKSLRALEQRGLVAPTANRRSRYVKWMLTRLTQ